MKPAKYKLYKCTHQQPVSRHNRLLLNRRYLSMSGPNPQSRASSSRPSITKADEAVLDNHNSALKDQCYNNTFSTVKELDIVKSPQGNAVKFQPPKIHFFQSYKPCVILSCFDSETVISEY